MDDKVKELLDRIRDTASAAADTAADTARMAGRKAGQDVYKRQDQHSALRPSEREELANVGRI